MKSSWSTLLRQAARILAARRGLDENGEENAESGFTLIELMVVLLILGILLAIAIPTFLGATKGASDKSAQSNVTTAIKAAQLVLSNHSPTAGTITDTKFATYISAAEPDLNFITNAATTANKTKITTIGVSYDPTEQTAVVTAWASSTKVCWMAEVGTDIGIRFGWNVKNVTVTTAGTKVNKLEVTTGTEATTCVASTFNSTGTTAGKTPKSGWSKVWPTAPTGH